MFIYPDEIWKSIKGQNGVEASTYGRIRKKIKTKYEIVTPRYKGKYLTVRLNNKTYFVHRLIALTFIPRQSKDLTVNHIDYNPENNHIDNLEWISEKSNQIHANRRPQEVESWLIGSQALAYLKHKKIQNKDTKVKRGKNG